MRNSVDIEEQNTLTSTRPSPDMVAEGRELSGILMESLKCLPENQRVALLLHKYDGFSYIEISRMMGCSVPAVESLIHRARQSLKKQLSPYL